MAPMINPFDAGGYTLAEMTTAINILPNIYTRLGRAGPVPLRGRHAAQRHHRAGRGRAEPPADRAAGRPRDGRQPRHPLDALVHGAVDPARRRHHAAGHPGRARLRRGGRGRSACDRDGAQAHPHARQARADAGVHGDQRAARRRQGWRRRRALRLLRRVRPRPASRSTSCSAPPAPTCRPNAARCCATSRPSSRARP